MSWEDILKMRNENKSSQELEKIFDKVVNPEVQRVMQKNIKAMAIIPLRKLKMSRSKAQNELHSYYRKKEPDRVEDIEVTNENVMVVIRPEYGPDFIR